MASLFWPTLLLLLINSFQASLAQQSYVNNKQLDCLNNDTSTLGYVCNGVSKSCTTYLTFRSTPVYNTPVIISDLLGTDASEIARINNISDVEKIPDGKLVVVPTNCACSGKYYQHNSSYVLKDVGESYFSVANVTYQGLTTCQSMIGQNSYNYLNLEKGLSLNVPLRCACPSSNQTEMGYKYLVVYLVDWFDSYSSIATLFNVDVKSLYLANALSPDDVIYPFTPLLVPVKSEPIGINTSLVSLSPPPSPPQLTNLPPPSDHDGKASHKWVFVGVGTGVGLLAICLVLGFVRWFFRYRSSHESKLESKLPGNGDSKREKFDSVSVDVYNSLPESDSHSWSEGIKYASETLTLYKYDELQKATGSFAEFNRIRGSVFRGNFNGDFAAVKMKKGSVLEEINVLKQIHHSSIIRLSGFCLHEGNTYLVYEYAENGCLSHWLHENDVFNGVKRDDQMKKENDVFDGVTRDEQMQKESVHSSFKLNWKMRVQIAYDVADALNYLHNYANPPYIHKNLKSSNILLDENLKAKLANFSLARRLGNDNQTEDGNSLEIQMTRHVIGTQGYMAPEYIENGLVTPKLDVFAFGVVMLELLSGKEAASNRDGKTVEEKPLSATINKVLEGDNVRKKLKDFIDPSLGQDYPVEIAYSLAQLARRCVVNDPNSRPTIAEVFLALSQIVSTSLDWDPSDGFEHSRSLGDGR